MHSPPRRAITTYLLDHFLLEEGAQLPRAISASSPHTYLSNTTSFYHCYHYFSCERKQNIRFFALEYISIYFSFNSFSNNQIFNSFNLMFSQELSNNIYSFIHQYIFLRHISSHIVTYRTIPECISTKSYHSQPLSLLSGAQKKFQKKIDIDISFNY